MTSHICSQHVREARAARENIEMFNDERFSRYRGLLHFMAGRVLGTVGFLRRLIWLGWRWRLLDKVT